MQVGKSNTSRLPCIGTGRAVAECMTILAAIDFSPVSARAMAVAQHWGKRLNEPVELVHVVSPPVGLPHEIGAGLAVFSEALHNAGIQQLEKLRATMANDGTEVRTKILFGDAELELPEYAAASSASMLVLGTHGRHGAARLFLGSTAERAVGHATVPVLVVPQRSVEGLTDTTKTGTLEIVAALSVGAQGDAVRKWLRAFRERIACNVTFVHVFNSAAEHRRLGIEGPYDDLDDDPELLALLRRDLLPLTALPGSGSTSLVLRSDWGKGPDPIAWEGTTDTADLLVIGIRRGKHLGAHGGAATLRAATVPVLCLPTAATIEAADADRIPRLARVLVATDLSASGNRAVPHAYQLVRAGGGRVDILHVVEAPETMGGLTKERQAVLERELAHLVPTDAELRGIQTRITIVGSDSAKEAILQAAERIRCDVIVLSSHGRSGVARTVLGSVADSIIREATRPVVVVGPKNGTQGAST
jgi:nucleotide-binding universal stress UspA family protein